MKRAEEFVKNIFSKTTDPNKYLYHQFSHTERVVQSVEHLCNEAQVKPQHRFELILAAWFHDVGYAESHKNHEQLGCAYLESFFKAQFPNTLPPTSVIKLIEATNLENRAENHLEQIIKDADLHYLGTDRYLDESENLRKEWEFTKNVVYTDQEWFHVNIDFLEFHRFYTPSAKTLYQEKKNENLKSLKNLVASHPGA